MYLLFVKIFLGQARAPDPAPSPAIAAPAPNLARSTKLHVFFRNRASYRVGGSVRFPNALTGLASNKKG